MSGWTAPRTWVTSELVTAAELNTNVRDNPLALPHPYGVIESTPIDVTSSTTETSLLTTTPTTITGGDMGATGCVNLRIVGDLLYNVGAATMRLKIKFGGTTVSDTGDVAPWNASSDRVFWLLDVQFQNLTASSQFMTASLFNTVQGGSTGLLTTGSSFAASVYGTAAKNTASNQNIDVTVQWGTNSASLSWRKQFSRLWLAQG